MDYSQVTVVSDYLSADRSMYINNECLLQLDHEKREKDRHWFCDILSIDMRESKAYLCEITIDKTLNSLLKRLESWDNNWGELRSALLRDCSIPLEWEVTPWVFIPAGRRDIFDKKNNFKNFPSPFITHLESITPWLYDLHARTDKVLDN